MRISLVRIIFVFVCACVWQRLTRISPTIHVVLSDQQNQIHCSPIDFSILWYVNIERWCLFVLQFPSECKNVKIFTVPKHRDLRAQDLIINLLGKSRMKKGKDVGGTWILLRRPFNYSTETCELFGGSYGIHQSDYTQLRKKKKPIHWINRNSAFELLFVLAVIVVSFSSFLQFLFLFVSLWFPLT